MMKLLKMLLAAFLLQLFCTKGAPESSGTQTFTYGDILVFQRNYCGFRLTHFAIYIDDIDTRFPGHKGNLFHITGKFWSRWWRGFSDCVFGEMTDELKTTMKKWNYLDNIPELRNHIRVATPQEITNRIFETMEDCPLWCHKQNCEHLATYIRYGVRVSLQFGQTMEGKCRPFSSEPQKLPWDVEQRVLARLHEIYDGTDDEEFYTKIVVSVEPSGAAARPSGAAARPSGAAARPSGAAVNPSGAAACDDTWFACGGSTQIISRRSGAAAHPKG